MSKALEALSQLEERYAELFEHTFGEEKYESSVGHDLIQEIRTELERQTDWKVVDCKKTIDAIKLAIEDHPGMACVAPGLKNFILGCIHQTMENTK